MLVCNYTVGKNYTGGEHAHEIVQFIPHLSRESVIGLGIALGLSLTRLLKLSTELFHEEMVRDWLNGADSAYHMDKSWKSFARGLGKMNMMDIMDDIKKGFKAKIVHIKKIILCYYCLQNTQVTE